MKRTIKFNEGDIRLKLIDSFLLNDDFSVTIHSPIHEILTFRKVYRKLELSEIFALPGYYAASIYGNRRFGTIYRSIFEGQTVHCSVKMEPIFCPETSETNYKSTLRNVLVERGSQLHPGGSLKLRN